MLLERPLFDIWVSVKLTNGDIYDIDAPELEELKRQIEDPENVECYGPVSIEKVNIMSKIVVGIR